LKEISVAVIGSGSTYCPELIDGFIKAQDSLKLKSIALMDIMSAREQLWVIFVFVCLKRQILTVKY